MAEHGGKREGSGRKTKAEELGLADLIDSVWSIPKQKKVLKKLAEDCDSPDFHQRHESRKLLLAYKFGKPTEKIEHSGGVEMSHRQAVDLSKLSDDELDMYERLTEKANAA